MFFLIFYGMRREENQIATKYIFEWILNQGQ